MKAFSTFITLFLISSLCSQCANSETDSCSSNLPPAIKAKFGTTSLNCDAVWTAQNYILRYAQASSDMWSFVLSAPNTNSYVAMGFSPNGAMVGSSAMVGWVDSSGVGGIKQYYLGGKTPSQVVADKGNLVIVGNSTLIVAVGSSIYIGFQLTTSMPGNLLIYAVGTPGVLPSSPSYQLTEHIDRVSTSINYVTASPGPSSPSLGPSSPSLDPTSPSPGPSSTGTKKSMGLVQAGLSIGLFVVVTFFV